MLYRLLALFLLCSEPPDMLWLVHHEREGEGKGEKRGQSTMR